MYKPGENLVYIRAAYLEPEMVPESIMYITQFGAHVTREILYPFSLMNG